MNDPVDQKTQEIDGSSRIPARNLLRRVFSLLALFAIAVAIILCALPYETAVGVAWISSVFSLPLTVGYLVMICISSGPDNVRTTIRGFVRVLLLFMAGIASLYFTTAALMSQTTLFR